MTITVNGHTVEPVCYIDGHWGQYGPDRLAEIAEGFGWEAPEERVLAGNRDDPRWWRMIADALAEGIVPNGTPPGVDEATAWEAHVEAGDRIERWLNDHTPPVCPDCGQAMFATSDGFYRHVDYPSDVAAERIDCVGATDSPIFPCWEWVDGEFFLSLYDDEGEPLGGD